MYPQPLSQSQPPQVVIQQAAQPPLSQSAAAAAPLPTLDPELEKEYGVTGLLNAVHQSPDARLLLFGTSGIHQIVEEQHQFVPMHPHTHHAAQANIDQAHS